jgi:hypothetical protein
VPRISAFYGIVIYMYYNEHEPPHFHAIYGEFRVEMSINEGLAVMRGRLPRRAQGLVTEWAALHLEELRENWRLGRAEEQFRSIPPLE